MENLQDINKILKYHSDGVRSVKEELDMERVFSDILSENPKNLQNIVVQEQK